MPSTESSFPEYGENSHDLRSNSVMHTITRSQASEAFCLDPDRFLWEGRQADEKELAYHDSDMDVGVHAQLPSRIIMFHSYRDESRPDLRLRTFICFSGHDRTWTSCFKRVPRILPAAFSSKLLVLTRGGPIHHVEHRSFLV